MSSQLSGVQMLSNPTSGSIDIEELLKEMLLAQSSSSKTKKEPTPYQVVSGSGDAWYFSPNDKKMVRVQRGTEILVLAKDTGIDGKVYVTDSSSKVFLMPIEEVIDIGYN
jgi:hypothetical protein